MSGIPSWAVRGAKVVCISAFGGNAAPHIPTKGVIYTISDLDPDHQFGPMLRLVEFGEVQVSRNITRIYSYPVACFRPLVTLETDISTHFRQHLDVRELVEA